MFSAMLFQRLGIIGLLSPALRFSGIIRCVYSILFRYSVTFKHIWIVIYLKTVKQ